ncbi:hypothetical protein Tco_0491312 [Tanacetum coccineum]
MMSPLSQRVVRLQGGSVFRFLGFQTTKNGQQGGECGFLGDQKEASIFYASRCEALSTIQVFATPASVQVRETIMLITVMIDSEHIWNDTETDVVKGRADDYISSTRARDRETHLYRRQTVGTCECGPIEDAVELAKDERRSGRALFVAMDFCRGERDGCSDGRMRVFDVRELVGGEAEVIGGGKVMGLWRAVVYISYWKGEGTLAVGKHGEDQRRSVVHLTGCVQTVYIWNKTGCAVVWEYEEWGRMFRGVLVHDLQYGAREAVLLGREHSVARDTAIGCYIEGGVLGDGTLDTGVQRICVKAEQRARTWKHAWKREKVIACTSRQLKVLMKDCMANMKDIASCGSKYLACAEMEVEYKGSSGLLLRPEIPEWKWGKDN